MQHREFHTRAAADVRDDFKRQNHDLVHGQGLQYSAVSRQRTRELESFAANRAEAIRHHAGRIEEINSREVKAAQELAKKQNSIGGRLSAFTKKGRDRQEQERQGLAEKFENDRMKQHRDLAALQERQAGNEQKARLRYGMELKAMREGHVATRSEQRGWQDTNRPRLIERSVTARRQEAAQTLRQERLTQDREREPLTRTFSATTGNQTRQQQDRERESMSRAFNR
jgi:hypothetical protein